MLEGQGDTGAFDKGYQENGGGGKGGRMRKERQGRDQQRPATREIASQVWAEPWEEGRRSSPSQQGWEGGDWLQI